MTKADPAAYCKSGATRLCPGVEPGGGILASCLKDHRMERSMGCGEAIQRTSTRPPVVEVQLVDIHCR